MNENSSDLWIPPGAGIGFLIWTIVQTAKIIEWVNAAGLEWLGS